MDLDLEELFKEVQSYTQRTSELVKSEGDHVYSHYQEITSMSMRLGFIRQEIAMREILGEADMPHKKFRTMILDPAIEQLNKAATFESRKMSGKQMEWEQENGGVFSSRRN